MGERETRKRKKDVLAEGKMNVSRRKLEVLGLIKERIWDGKKCVYGKDENGRCWRMERRFLARR